jgi:ATP synthase protein I
MVMVQGDGGEEGGKTTEKPVNAGPDKRFSEISARIAAERREAEAAQTQTGQRTTALGKTWGTAFRLGTEFVAAVLVGGGIGYLIDRLLGTLPWGLIIMLLVGFVAGILNMARAAGRVPKAGDRLNDEP